MRTLFQIFLMLLVSAQVFSQTNDIKAKGEYFAAEEAYGNSNYRGTIEHLNKAETLLGSTNPKILYLKIKAYYNIADYINAYETQKKYFEFDNDPNDPKYNEIVRLIGKINEQLSGAYLNLGKKEYENYNINEANINLNKALEFDPNNAEVLFYIGLIQISYKNWEQAKQTLLLALENCKVTKDDGNINELYYYIIYRLGYAYYNLGDYNEAIFYFYRVIQSYNDNESYYYLACIYAQKNEISKSLEYLKKAKENGYNEFDKIESDPIFSEVIKSDKYKNIKSIFIDVRDGQAYETVVIGKQIWMKENLNFKTEDSYCYDNNRNCEIYGRLYTWQAAINACPDGWHLPSDEEWKELEIFLGMSEREANKMGNRGEPFGNKLKSESGWGYSYNGMNSSKFSALPAGFCINYGILTFKFIGSYAYFWTSTTNNKFRFARELNGTSGIRPIKTDGFNDRFSVRCIKN